MGFDEAYISSVLRGLFLNLEIGKMIYDKELIEIKLEAKHKDRVDSIREFYIDIPNSFKKIKLSEVVDFIYKKSDANIYKE